MKFNNGFTIIELLDKPNEKETSLFEVLNDTSGQYNGLKGYLQTELKTGSFDLAAHFLKSFGAFLQDVNYEDTHSYISKDNADTYAGDYAARLAERQTHNILSKVNQKCQ